MVLGVDNFIVQFAGMFEEKLLLILAGMGEERGLQCFVGKQSVQGFSHLLCIADGRQQSGASLVQYLAGTSGTVGSNESLPMMSDSIITVGNPSNLALWAIALAWAIHG